MSPQAAQLGKMTRKVGDFFQHVINWANKNIANVDVRC